MLKQNKRSVSVPLLKVCKLDHSEGNKEFFPTQHVVGHMNLNVPFAVEHHLTLDALVCLLL